MQNIKGKADIMKERNLSSHSGWIVLLVVLFSLTALASPPQKTVRHRTGGHGKVVTRLPHDHSRMIVNRTPYYYNRGVFYRNGRTGFIVTRAPIGARIRVLPPAYIRFYCAGIPYYYYYGTYYRYYPDEDFYTVVEKPADARSAMESGFDTVKMQDGTILKGVFIGGTQSVVQLDVDGEIREIDIADIASIQFASSVESEK